MSTTKMTFTETNGSIVELNIICCFEYKEEEYYCVADSDYSDLEFDYVMKKTNSGLEQINDANIVEYARVFCHKKQELINKINKLKEDVEEKIRKAKEDHKIVMGTVVQITDFEVCVYLDYESNGVFKYTEGVIKRSDLMEQDVKLGDDILVQIVKLDNGEGYVLLTQRDIMQGNGCEVEDLGENANNFVNNHNGTSEQEACCKEKNTSDLYLKDETKVTVSSFCSMCLGTVLQINDDNIIVSIGKRYKGIIKRSDLMDTYQDVKPGDEIAFEVTKLDDGEGHVLLSQRKYMNCQVQEVLANKKIENDLLKSRNAISSTETNSKLTKIDEEGESLVDESEDTAPAFDYSYYKKMAKEATFTKACIAYAAADYCQARSLFEEAGELGNYFAAARLGEMYYRGNGVKQDDEIAFEMFMAGFKRGCPLATAWIADFFRIGIVVEKDKTLAQRLFDNNMNSLMEMCNCGDSFAIRFLAMKFVTGHFCKRDVKTGLNMLENAYQLGDQNACLQLAKCYFYGVGVSEDSEKTLQYLLDNTLLNRNGEAQFILGQCYFLGEGTEENYPLAFQYFKNSTELGYQKAKLYLAKCYYNGWGTETNYEKAAQLFKDSADNERNSDAAYCLAFLYLNGEGVPQNKKIAIHYFSIAGEYGDTKVFRELSNWFLTGDGFEQDIGEAVKWLECAADKGDIEAKFNLGQLYSSDDYGLRDDLKAFIWFKQAAEQGYAPAEFGVGGSFEHGIGCTKDTVLAKYWYEKAVADGSTLAMVPLAMLLVESKEEYDTAFELLTKASNEQNAYSTYAFYYLGILYENGYGCLQDNKKAFNCYEKALKLGNEEATIPFIRTCIQTKSDYDYEEAFKQLSHFIQNNKYNGEANYLYGLCLENGIGCKVDHGKAKKFFREADKWGYHASEVQKKSIFSWFKR